MAIRPYLRPMRSMDDAPKGRTVGQVASGIRHPAPSPLHLATVCDLPLESVYQ